MSRIRRILHATDFSPASRAAFTKAVEFAKRDRAELTVLHVFAPVVPWVGEGYLSPLIATIQAEAQKKLDRLLAQARAAGVRARGLLLEGVPHERIVRTAASRGADLVVIGTHGRSGFARFFLGSVAARVIAMAPCPVLTIRGKSARRQK